MRQAQAFPSSYLRADDLAGKAHTYTITEVKLAEFDDHSKPVVHFEEIEAGLVLNKTNWNAIADITGEADTDDWTGEQVALYPTKVEFQGKRVWAIRVTEPQKAKDEEPIPF